ncbi:MAG: GDP-mannose 4,6-dehydratase, partial [Deltaproteobacteria bacterium]|nr:GDP-mannose 4,6-dehydratase [Deltaproteobacteria bacterium]
RVGLPLTWEGHGVDEVGRGPDGRVLVAIDPAYFRPAEVDLLLGDASRARAELGWTPKVTFRELVTIMVDHDVAEAARESHLQSAQGLAAPGDRPAGGR